MLTQTIDEGGTAYGRKNQPTFSRFPAGVFEPAEWEGAESGLGGHQTGAEECGRLTSAPATTTCP